MRGVRIFVGAALAVAVAGLVALLTHQPWLFPSLGPTVMLHVEKPEAPESSPRSTLIGHGVALVAGYLSLVMSGLTDDPSALQQSVSAGRIGAAAGALGVTTLALYLLKAPHPPAGATTLIVALGLLHTPTQLLIMAGAVVLVTVVDWLYTRATGDAMPVWSVAREKEVTHHG